MFYELIIVFTIVLASIMVYLHVLCPDSSSWTTPLYTFKTTFYHSVQMYCFQVLLFLSNVVMLALWYITCRYWWRIAVFVLLVVWLYNFFVIFMSEVQLSEINGKVLIYFLTGLCSVLVYYIGKKSNYPLWNRLTLDAIDAEEILRYKFKNANHYTRVLNRFDEESYQSNMDNLKELVANAVLISEDDDKQNANPFFESTSAIKTIGSVCIFVCLLLLLVLDKVYLLAPADEKVWDLGLLQIQSYEFLSVRIFLWFTMLKVSTFIMLTIWFLTTRYWWKYFLLIPITIVSYQLIATFNVDIASTHETEIWSALPVLLPLLLFLTFLSVKINNFTKVEKIKNNIKVKTFKVISFLAREEEESVTYDNVKQELAILISNKDSYEPDEYLQKLEALHNELIQKKRS